MENPIFQWMIWGENPLFLETFTGRFSFARVAAMSGGYDGSELISSREEWSALEVSFPAMDGDKLYIYII